MEFTKPAETFMGVHPRVEISITTYVGKGQVTITIFQHFIHHCMYHRISHHLSPLSFLAWHGMARGISFFHISLYLQGRRREW